MSERDLLALIRNETAAHLGQLKGPDASDVYSIIGVWKSEYVLQLSEAETVYHLRYVRVETASGGQGCSYFDDDSEPALSRRLIGRDARTLDGSAAASVQIAALDAVWASFPADPTQHHVITGTNIEKAGKRTTIVSDQALNLLQSRPPKHGRRHRVVNVGVVGSIIAEFARHPEVELSATDIDNRAIIGQTVHGIHVQHGTETLKQVADADVAIVTGMTLVNKTLGPILETASRSGTGIVLFAETGANFAPFYCRNGVDVVISEPFPFYLTTHGDTVINVFTRC